MPETSMYENHLASTREHKVRISRQIFTMQTVAESIGVEQTADNHFWRSIF